MQPIPQPQPRLTPAAAAGVQARDLLGVPVAMVDYDRAIEVMDGLVEGREPGYVCAAPVHALIEARRNPEMLEALRGSTLVVPDGMPLVWAANLLGEELSDRVYGPELMLRYSDRCAERGHRVWLYGGRDQGTLVQLALSLRQRHPGIQIVGGYSPPFRPLAEEEESALVAQINEARPDVLWVGIGVPKQEMWMARMRDRLEVPVMCGVGAAFDFHAGRIPMAPSWMQDRGLEWIYRIGQEPKRLLPRYLYTNPRFVAVLEQVAAGRMPFRETGTQEVLERVLAAGRFERTRAVQDAARADHIVLTLGTPSHVHIEIDMSQIRRVVDDLLPVLREGHSLVLRSTVAPGTTDWVAGYIEQRRGFRVGEDLFVAHVPERIAENHYLEEIATLPCIVGGVGEGSGARAAELFDVFGTEIVQTTPTQAELAKIWTNILRYAQFALPNLLMMEAEQYGANVFEVIDLINHDYPRGGIAAPGLTAGACLRKDFTFSEERSSSPGMLLAVSRVHETVPLFLVKGLRERLGGSLRDRKVAVLGLTFKRDSDDVRDSLSYKLVRLLERELAHVARHDPHVPSDPFSTAVEGADAVVVATNHSSFEDLLGRLPAR